jgi:hypothetical protein
MTVLHMVPPSSGLLQAHIAQVDEKHEDGHKRLREDVRALEIELHTLKTAHDDLVQRVAQQAAKPVDLEDVRVSWKMAASIIIALITLAGSQWAAWSDIKTTVATTIESQSSRLQVQADKVDALSREQALERVRMEETRRDLAKIEGLMTGRKR